ncbi:hypothetical protein SASPL_117407 [Salvia splendens]|uniref:Uncharacterized protein n=1 Tax=Salvia splendens TaxID=180675 RepID=A0A8X8XXV5_SALSN|nr:hypothetical protein SASPL_117407 [Salvia splendens]
MCCGSRICCLCMCVVVVVIAIGLLFGFGVFEHGFHKLKDAINVCQPSAACGPLDEQEGNLMPEIILYRFLHLLKHDGTVNFSSLALIAYIVTNCKPHAQHFSMAFQLSWSKTDTVVRTVSKMELGARDTLGEPTEDL